MAYMSKTYRSKTDMSRANEGWHGRCYSKKHAKGRLAWKMLQPDKGKQGSCQVGFGMLIRLERKLQKKEKNPCIPVGI
jgi:hypothetical protein